MKLVLAIIHDYDVDAVLRTLLDRGFSVTRIASAGGFLRTGNVTVLIGVEDQDVDLCVDLIAAAGSRRRVPAPVDARLEWDETATNGLADVTLGGVSIFVLPVERFERIFAPSHATASRR